MNGTDAQLNVILTAQDDASAAVQNAANNINNSLGNVQGSAEKASMSMADIGSGLMKGGGAIAGIGAAITAPIAGMISAAEDAQKSWASVHATLSAMNEDTPKTVETIKNASEAAVNLGFDGEDAAKSITRFYQATGDLTTAQKLNNTAMDLARAKNLDLATATNLVNMVLSGNGRALKQYQINLKDSASPLEALGELQQKVGGQSLAFSKTLAGQQQIAEAKTHDLYVALGDQLVPILTTIVTKINAIIPPIQDWIMHHQTLVKNVLIFVGVFGVVLTILGGVMLLVGGLILLFGSFGALIAGGVAIAIAGFIAAGALVILNWGKVKDFFATLWDDIKNIFKAAWDWINTNVIQPMMNAINAVKNAASNIGGGIKSAAGSVGGAISGAASSAWNWVTSPFRATGGPVSSGSPYIVGEEGPELFVPGMSGSIVPNGKMGGSGSVAISVNINGGLITDDVAKQIGNVIIQQFKRTSRW